MNSKMAEIVTKLRSEKDRQVDPREGMLQNIRKGAVIPVISNSFRIEQIFRELIEGVASSTEGLSVYEQLSQVWASEMGYPGEDGYNLARVAKYFIEQIDDPELSKVKYLNFLSHFLLAIAEDVGPVDPNLRDVLKAQNDPLSFSRIVRDLEYPRFPADIADPLRLLAKLPFHIYITTSYFNFLELALEAEGRTPKTQICIWSEEMPGMGKEHDTKREFIPSLSNPLVYHFYGLEDDPQTLVLSEDDYLNFLISVGADNNTVYPSIPLHIRKAVAESQLLLLGYKISEWEFRILFKLFTRFRRGDISPRGFLVLLGEGNKSSSAKEIEYLRTYFGRHTFDLEWNTPERFVQKLWDDWNAYQESES